MSSINTSPRRPSTAQPSTPRLPFEAAEALLWQRQNARANTHLHAQMTTLQATHDAYDARIAATEAVAEAAEAAVSRVQGLERKMEALEADEREGPFVRWCKEAVTGLQGSFEEMRGVRKRVSGLDGRVERLGEDIEGWGRRMGVLEDEVRRLRAGVRRTEDVQEEVEDLHGEAQTDDDPLMVFYGIDPQSPERRQISSARFLERERASTAGRHHVRSSGGLTESPQRSRGHTVNLQPPDGDIARPEGDSFNVLQTAPGNEYGWENTQQFKDMQKELIALRAMCRTQEPKSSNESAEATQRPQETLIVGRENNIDFSDATTEAEADFDDKHGRFRQGTAGGSVGALSSDMQLPSSPPKRTKAQSARLNLMKRPSIYDPRVPSVNEQLQPDPDALTSSEEPVPPSLLLKLPAEAPLTKTSTKRKRLDDAQSQRMTRPKVSDDRATPRQPVVSAARKEMSNEETTFAGHLPLTFIHETPALPSPTRTTYSRQKSTANDPLQQAGLQPGPSRAEQPVMQPAEAVKSRKAISKPKPEPKLKTAPAQQPPPKAIPSTSRKAPTAVKREARGPRQPTGACKPCRSRHQKCDRIQPSCGRCVKSGSKCEYPQTSTTAAQAATTSRKEPALLPIKEPANEAPAKARERSETVSAEAPRPKSPAKRPAPVSPSKKPTVATAPTAASSRTPRTKNTSTSKASSEKK